MFCGFLIFRCYMSVLFICTVYVWMMIRQHMVCIICVYGPQTGRTEAEKEAFREEVERLAGLSDGQTMLCVAGDFNAHIGMVEPGDGESVGRFGWGTRNREWRELVEMLRRNGLAAAGKFSRRRRTTKSPTGADGTRL